MKKIEPAIFNWSTAKGSTERIEWLRENYNKPITEAEYIQHEKELPHKHFKAARCRSTSTAKNRYAWLKARFGFFTSNPRVNDA